MKRTVGLTLCLFLSFVLFAEDIHSVETVYKPGDEQYARLTRKINWYNASGDLVKVEYYHSEAFTEKTEYVKQTEYLRDGLPYKYEMFFSPKAIDVYGISAKVDYVDEKDNIVKIGLVFPDSSVWDFEGQNIAIVDRFFPRSFTSILDFYANEDPSDLTIEAPVFTGLARLEPRGKPIKMETGTLELISHWCEMHNSSDMAKLYSYQISLEISGKRTLLALQDCLLDIVDYQKTLAYFYYIGAVKGQPVLLVVGFFE